MRLVRKRVVVTCDHRNGRRCVIGQVRHRFMGIPYWSDLMEFDELDGAVNWAEIVTYR